MRQHPHSRYQGPRFTGREFLSMPGRQSAAAPVGLVMVPLPKGAPRSLREAADLPSHALTSAPSCGPSARLWAVPGREHGLQLLATHRELSGHPWTVSPGSVPTEAPWSRSPKPVGFHDRWVPGSTFAPGPPWARGTQPLRKLRSASPPPPVTQGPLPGPRRPRQSDLPVRPSQPRGEPAQLPGASTEAGPCYSPASGGFSPLSGRLWEELGWGTRVSGSQ